MMPDDTETKTPRPRAVFSPQDFDLLKEAMGDFIRNLPEDDNRSQKAAALFHRLGRAG